MQGIRNTIKKHSTFIVLVLTILISLGSFTYFFYTGKLLSDYDAIARLNIARKVIDSLTPGIGQLGGIWLPFPQLLMIPFVKSDFLWRSGIAGSIVSMIAFIISSVMIYKTIVLMTKNKWCAGIAWLVYVTNINLLLLQSMGMSESFFLMGMVLALYFLTRWTIQKDLESILFASASISLITLTRYEGYAIFLSSFITIVISTYIFFKSSERKKVEGIIIMFITLASFGIVLWTLYSLLIYKDPIYWLDVYTGKKSLVNSVTAYQAHTSSTGSLVTNKARGVLPSFIQYFWATTLMLGIPVMFLSIFGNIILVIDFIKRFIQKREYAFLLPLFVTSVVLILFLVFGYYRGIIPPIGTPPFTFSTILTKSSNFVSNSNIRYGIIFLPIAAVVIGYFSAKKRIIAGIVFICIIVQVIAYFYTPLFLSFQLQKTWNYSVPTYTQWFRAHYTGGLILLSANKYEPFMLQSNLPYKTFIYEGSQKYWTDSLKEPSKYASWVIMDPSVNGDFLAKYLKNPHDLQNNFKVVYQKGTFKIYKIKTKPEVQISQK